MRWLAERPLRIFYESLRTCAGTTTRTSVKSHYFAEVDIVLPGEMPLQHAHDIGESLQDKLESLPEIERAFVHLDYEVTHRPEHAYKD
jgi:divalent metal cation (Fe/Co/Zn/Cd) transporter